MNAQNTVHRQTSSQQVKLTEVRLDVTARQRQQGRDEHGVLEVEADGLLASIQRDGVLSPILLHRDGRIIFGERRYTCAMLLKMETIPALYIEDLSVADAQRYELIENIKRRELHWKDEVLAIARLHDICAAENANWSVDDTEREIGYRQGGNWARVAKALRNNDPRIQRCISMREAWNLLHRGDQRAQADIINDITDAGFSLLDGGDAVVEETLPSGIMPTPTRPDSAALGADPDVVAAPRPTLTPGALRLVRPADTMADQSVLKVDFVEWVQTYTGPRFNFIHCDFPYGKGVFSGPMSGRDRWAAQYDDDVGVYWHLIRTLCENLDRIMAPSAHLMFWLAADIEIQAKTIEKFRDAAPSLIFDTYPLTWLKSDNAGIAVDARRKSRRITETALYASRDDRPIVKLVGNGYAAPTDKQHHPHTKPEPVLRHFFSMFVDSGTRILDPTCGGGSALRAAESMGAAYVLGLESSDEHHSAAVSAMRSFRAKRKASGEV